MTKFISVLAFALILSIAAFAINKNYYTDANDQPLRILEQPPVQQSETVITDFVEGSVLLRVEFLSTGKIGEVTLRKAKKKMQKNGQVEAAINAAKKIRFEPAKKDDKPITVVKTVEYTFHRAD